MATKKNSTTNALEMTVEVHSTIKKAKATGNEFRSYFATAINGEDLPRPMSVVFTKGSGGKPRAAHAILKLIADDDALRSSFGKDRYTGKQCIFIADPYTETAVEPRKTSTPLAPPSKWTEGNRDPDPYVPEQYGGEHLGFETVADDEEIPF